jgi:DNA repair protein RadC
MGGIFPTAECRRAFRESFGNASTADCLRMDEERPDLGGSDPLDYRHVHPSSTEVFARQRLLLARLIGGELVAAEVTAARLLSTFGSIGGVLSAQPLALTRAIDDCELAKRLEAARLAVMEGLTEKVWRMRFELTDVSLQQWVVGLFKGYRRERIHLALLDGAKQLILDEPLAEGDLRGVTGNLRKIVSSGIGLDASGVVLMHNHPSGNVLPSPADIEETRRIAFLLSNLDMTLEDHLIVSGNTIYSMRGAMLL